MWPRLQRTAAGDSGAFAVLYAFVLLIVIGLAAIVVDLSSLRSDRRLNRAAADNAALAATTVLGNPPDARSSCLAAWHYTLADLGVSAPDSAISCSTFPAVGSPGYSYCPATSKTATGTITLNSANQFTVTVSWPVPDTSDLMLHPDTVPVGSAPTQTVVQDDGDSCNRVAVGIKRTRPFVLAGVFAASGSSTYSHSVALSTFQSGVGDIAAPLVVLDPKSCNALTAEGGGAVLIAPNDANAPGVPGMIVVDSDGTGGDVACSSNATTINSNAIAAGHDCSPSTFTTGQCNSAIWAQDSATGGRAHLYSVALRDGVTHSYDPAQVTCTGSNPPSGPLCPRPELMRSPISRWVFIDNHYNCAVRTSCATSDQRNGVAQLKSFVNTDFASTGDCLTATYPAGFSCVSKSTVCTAGTCTSSGSTNNCTHPATTYTGNVYVDCPAHAGGGFSVGATTAFPGLAGGGGTIIFSGDVTVQGCLAFNLSSSDASTWCTTPSMAPLSHDGPVVVVQGQLNASSNSSTFIAPQTFVLLGNCNSDGTSCAAPSGVSSQNLNIQSGANGGGILWTAPLGPGSGCTPGVALTAPTTACFAKMALWGEFATPSTGSSSDFLTGQSRLMLQGTFFTPNAQFNLAGGNNTDIRSAQFVTKRLDVKGGGLLTMIPDADHTNPPPLLVGTLIR